MSDLDLGLVHQNLASRYSCDKFDIDPMNETEANTFNICD